MAEPQEISFSALVSQVDGIQEGLRQALAAGTVSLDEEIQVRVLVAQCLHHRFKRLQLPKDLSDAIDHLETVVRRLPPDTPELPKHLDELSYMKVSEYGINQSVLSLNQAIDFGKKAKEIALKVDLLATDPDAFFSILNNLGYAQSHRWGASEQPQDLDDAISSGQEILQSAPKDSAAYRMAQANLASRMRLRYQKFHNVADREEAMRLINETLEHSSAGGIERAMSHFQLGELAYEKFKEGHDLKDLDKAIEQVAACLLGLTARHEKYADILKRICQMYCDRYNKMKDIADARQVLRYSRMRVYSALPSQPNTETHIYEHMLYVRDFVTDSSDVSAVEEAIKESASFMKGLRKQHTRREACYWVFGDILGRQYELSGRLEHLITFVENNETICSIHNERMHQQGEEDVSSEKVAYLLKSLRRIAKAPNENQLKVLACKKLPGYFRAACDLSGVPNAPIAIYNANGVELEEIADALESKPDTTEAELKEMVENRQLRILAAKEESRNKPIWRPEQYHTEFGVRSLAIDPANGLLVFSMPAKVCDVFGYKTMESLPIDQFVKQEQRLERETRETETNEGRNPNPNLCRICRKLKILKSSSDGFIWNQEVEFIPYGNYNQLLCRPCSVCSLILTLISKDGSLHPRLAAIDPEIKGTAIEPIKLPSGEQVLCVKYGLREVGSLRIVSVHQKIESTGSPPIKVAPRSRIKNWWKQVGSRRSLGSQQEAQSSLSPPLGAQALPLSRIKNWLNNCDHNHGRKCNPLQLSNAIAMFQIDVLDSCLVRTHSTVKYFALSYVWGKVSMSQTLRENLDARLKKDGLVASHLPKTIQDAMSLVKSLGERYLWVDALCIVQDDDENKLRDIQQMDVVYSQAFATIVAMEGVDADAGLPGIVEGTRSPQAVKSIIITGRSPDMAYIPQSSLNEEISVAATPISFGLALDASKWDTRAWTLQEHLLSKRCLYFSNDCVYFQCNRELNNETDVPEPQISHASSTLENPLQILNETETSDDSNVRRSFGAYKSLVEKYTLRELSFPADILNAFAGVSAVLEEHISGGMLFGIPAELMDLALLWTPARPVERRLDLLPNSGILAKASKGPTWSWAGFVGPVEYRLFVVNQSGPLPVPLIESYSICHGGQIVQTIKLQETSSSQTGKRHSTSKEVDTALIEMATPSSTVLEFEAMTVPTTKFKIGTELEYLSLQEHIHTSGQASVVRLYDKDSKHCGLCFNIPTIIPETAGNDETMFVAVSRERARNVGGRGAGHSAITRVEGEIPLSDVDVYGPGEVVNVLLVTGGEVAERITVARIHLKAWDAAGPVKRVVRLK